MKRPEIWAVGGGKGGTGKSFISCTIGLELSRLKRSTIVIDGDLGGSNIHSFFGREKVNFTLSDFFKNRLNLQEVISDSGIKNLGFIAGDIQTVNPVGLPFFSRAKLYRKIKELDTDIVIIDLGAGSVLNIIDTFLIADKKIVITTPEITSIENLYLFIKKVLIRKISDLYVEQGYGKIVKQFWKNKNREEPVETFADFIDYLKNVNSDLAEEIDRKYSHICFNILLNQVRSIKQTRMGISLMSIIKNHFKVESAFSGFIDYEKNFWEIIEGKEPITEITKNSKLMNSIAKIVQNILEEKSYMEIY